MAQTLTSSGSVLPFPIRARHLALTPGDAGVKLTITEMIRAVVESDEGARNPNVRAWALAAVNGAPDRDDAAQASAIYEAVKQNIKFRGEYSETVQTPLLTLQLRAGDCDDHATLLAALLRSIGIPARFETVATDESREFTHVFCLAGIRRGGRIVAWMPLDTTVPAAYPGWKPPVTTREKVWGGLGQLADGEQQQLTEQQQIPVSQKTADAIALIREGASAGVEIARAVRNTGNSADFNVGRGPGGGISGSLGMSSNVLLVGGLGLAGLLAVMMRRGR